MTDKINSPLYALVLATLPPRDQPGCICEPGTSMTPQSTPLCPTCGPWMYPEQWECGCTEAGCPVCTGTRRTSPSARFDNDRPVSYARHALGSLPGDCQGCSDYLERRAREAARHDVVVDYAIHDGTHLLCTCGADIPCGFNPTPSELVARERQHQQEAQS
jgi:hypothetical protein